MTSTQAPARRSTSVRTKILGLLAVFTAAGSVTDLARLATDLRTRVSAFSY